MEGWKVCVSVCVCVCVTWDVIVVMDTTAQTYLPVACQTSGAAAEAAADRKTATFAPLTFVHRNNNMIFIRRTDKPL